MYPIYLFMMLGFTFAIPPYPPPSPHRLPPSPPSLPPTKSLSSIEIQGILIVHNNIRKNYQTTPLTWNTDLAVIASTWANKCVFDHSPYPWGENIAIGYTNVVKLASLWYQDEECKYQTSPSQAGHFTQLVWASTTSIGCAIAKNCTNGIKMDPSSLNKWYNATMLICEYNPAGNGGNYALNVLKPLIPPNC